MVTVTKYNSSQGLYKHSLKYQVISKEETETFIPLSE